jgi:2-oxoglutarate ferredoxin oxidoreductase subunit gamma
VIISEESIGSPLVRRPDIVLALNLPSLDKYEPVIQPGGVLVGNASLTNREIERDDIASLLIPANEIAEEIGMARLANMVMVGAMIPLKTILTLEMVKDALNEHIPERHRKTLKMNFKAIERGYSFAQEAKSQTPA